MNESGVSRTYITFKIQCFPLISYCSVARYEYFITKLFYKNNNMSHSENSVSEDFGFSSECKPLVKFVSESDTNTSVAGKLIDTVA